MLLGKVDWAYWAERYAQINVEGQGMARPYPLFDSQKLILNELALLELQIHEGTREDGILVNLLKARQLGASTEWEMLQAHRMATQNNIFGLVASDEPGTSAYLFDMFERIIENLPWYMRPGVKEHVKNTEMLFDGGSHIWMGSGKSTRGTEGMRGQLGRGKTLSVVHLSELSTWEATDQIDGALLPTMPPSARTLAGFESTAKGRNNWWHKHWKLSKAGGRFHCIFIPWFAEPKKYRKTPPDGWEPAGITLAHAARCEAAGPRWLHRPVKLSKDQLFWYQETRKYYEERERLSLFLEEYAADDDEAFQFSGQGVFPSAIMQRHEEIARGLAGAYEIGPMREIQREA